LLVPWPGSFVSLYSTVFCFFCVWKRNQSWIQPHSHTGIPPRAYATDPHASSRPAHEQHCCCHFASRRVHCRKREALEPVTRPRPSTRQPPCPGPRGALCFFSLTRYIPSLPLLQLHSSVSPHRLLLASARIDLRRR
jgi:hypothetical protein